MQSNPDAYADTGRYPQTHGSDVDTILLRGPERTCKLFVRTPHLQRLVNHTRRGIAVETLTSSCCMGYRTCLSADMVNTEGAAENG